MYILLWVWTLYMIECREWLVLRGRMPEQPLGHIVVRQLFAGCAAEVPGMLTKGAR